MTLLVETFKDWQEEKLTDGEALDIMLERLETAQPRLREEILNTSGDDLTDADAIQKIADYYCLKYFKK